MHNNSDEQNEKVASNGTRKIAIFFGIVVVLLWLANLYVGLKLPTTERGILGDTFGAVNALFSGLAFVGLIYTILLQSQELKLQRLELALTRKEMEETREEIEGQKKALELQSATMIKQQFESSFFKILERLNQISNLINVQNQKFSHFNNHLLSEIRKDFNLNSSIIPDNFKKIVLDFHKDNPRIVGYRYLLSKLFQFVDETKQEDKSFYINLIIASIENSELEYHFLSAFIDAETNLKFYFEKYSAFQGIIKDPFSDTVHQSTFNYIISQYEPNAFNS
jgi:Putative phage abortive infection protein